MRLLKPLCFLLLFVTVLIVLDSRLGQVPPLGKFLNPFAGFWLNNESSDALPETIALPELLAPVRVVWDDRRVPHIFAENDFDLYVAQGYITARDRLWQMDFSARASSGRLAEILGPTFIEYDRFRRRIGIVEAAEEAVRAIEEDSASSAAIRSYTDGVNAYLRSLNKRRLPLEYKIFDYEPEEWSPLKTALLIKQFAHTLSFRSTERGMTNSLALFGDSAFAALYPLVPPFMVPIVPPQASTGGRSIPDAKHRSETRMSDSPGRSQNQFNASNREAIQFADADEVPGSNNWAVAGSKTRTGFPILANDPHLNLTLPSIWYEVQLVSPNVNVYGVSSPGGPGVVIGFNRHAAWGVTNGGSDVVDYYRITLKNESPHEYLHNGAWHPTERRVYEIAVRGRSPVLDTVYTTVHGPIVYLPHEKPFDTQVPPGTALRWTAHDRSNEWKTFMQLNRAKNDDDVRSALSHFDCPPQNFVFADLEGTIAVVHNGKFPVRAKGEGRFIRDGSNAALLWSRFVPRDSVPRLKNPPRGYVSSANQPPVDSSFPHYLGSNYAGFERGARINEVLEGLNDATAEDMVALQNDVLSPRARLLLPTLLSHLRAVFLTEEEETVRAELASWNYEYRATLIAPRIFESWWAALYEAIWLDEFPAQRELYELPRSDVTINLILNDPDNPCFDNKATPQRESLPDLIASSFRSTVKQLTERFGTLGTSWQWGTSRGTSIGHLARIPGLGRTGLFTAGAPTTVNATSTSFGPSWRMVVELGERPRAWGTYPGGQSGNPGSKYYDRFVDSWVRGEVAELIFLTSPDESNARLIGTTLMEGTRR